MILVLIVGGVMGWKARKVSFQKRAVAAIQHLNGSFIYDWEYDSQNDMRKPAATLTGPIWLRRLLGDEYFQEIAYVELPSERIPPLQPYVDPQAYKETYERPYLDDQLACLEGLDRLQSLDLRCMPSGLNNEGWERLGRLAQLRVLDLSGHAIDNDGQANLKKLSELESLSIKMRSGDAKDLAFLERLPKLRSLTIIGSPMTDLGRLTELQGLSVQVKSGDADGLAFLERLPKLRSLTLTGSPVTDTGLVSIARRTSIEGLCIDGSQLTGLKHLLKLPNLKVLTIVNCQISDEAIDSFKAARPKTRVDSFR